MRLINLTINVHIFHAIKNVKIIVAINFRTRLDFNETLELTTVEMI